MELEYVAGGEVMAERDTLLSTLPDDVREDAAELYTDKATQDPRDVLAELHKRGRIDAGQLRSSVLQLEAQLRIRRIKEKPPEELEPTVLGPLGEGAMGEVLLARDEGLNRVVALKRLHPDHANHKGLLRRFYTEAQVTAQLDHPSIVPIHGVYSSADGSLAYSMKLVRGETLEDYLEEAQRQETKGAPDPDHNLQSRLHRFLHACDAIAYAHSKGVLHRDLKPENIMVGAFGEVLVMDWGIAKLLEGANVELLDVDTGLSRQATQTRIGRVVGTPRYMSPEQAAGQNDVIDARSDQYAMGLILQEMVTFTPACPSGVTLEQALARAVKGQRQPMKSTAGAKPKKAIVAIVDKACAVDPNKRYATVHDLAEDVRRYLRDEPVSAKRDGLLDKLGRFVSRHRTGVLVTILLLIITLLVTSGMLATAGLAAHEYQRWSRASDEERIRAAFSNNAQSAHLIDEELLQIESLLVGLSFTAERSLRENLNDVKLPSDWDPNRLPRYAKKVPKSKLYGRTVLADFPTMSISQRGGSGEIGANVRDDVARLFSMAPQMGRALGDSPGRSSEPLKRNDLNKMVTKGVPARWVRVGTENGVMATAPGGLTMQRGVDPRKEFWYREAKDTARATWIVPPAVDPNLKELVITVAHPVFDEKRGRLQAVVSLDLSLDELIQRMRRSKANDAWLMDKKGHIVAARSMHNARSYDPEPFPDKHLWEKEILPDLTQGEGGFRTSGSKIYTWTPLTTAPWVLVTESSF